ncbi:MAG: hypothetical protein K8I82_25805 [Anaerolineae bacterium]|nr:hypothetical protein [Anaerolineae bacterium]
MMKALRILNAFALLAASSLLVYWQWRQAETQPRFIKMLLAANGAVVLVLIALYLPANLGVFQTTALEFGYPMRHHFVPPEDCVRNFALYRQVDCLESPPLKKSTDDDIYKLAYYGLGVFREAEPINLLPSSYHAGQPLLLNTPTRWMGLYLNRWYLGDIPDADVLYLAPPPLESTARIEQLPHKLDNISSKNVVDFVGEADTIWVVHTRETSPDALHEILTDAGYIYTPVMIADYRYGSELRIIRYDRPPETLREVYRFGEVFSMQGFSLLSDYMVRPCDAVRLQSWWTMTQASETMYSATLVAVGENGLIVGREDDGLAFSLPAPFWETEKLYVDERILSIDCDAPPGKYDLLFGMYIPAPVQDLEVSLSDGTPIGSRAYLTTIIVEEQH